MNVVIRDNKDAISYLNKSYEMLEAVKAILEYLANDERASLALKEILTNEYSKLSEVQNILVAVKNFLEPSKPSDLSTTATVATSSKFYGITLR